jgi:hypothetical protein
VSTPLSASKPTKKFQLALTFHHNRHTC